MKTQIAKSIRISRIQLIALGAVVVLLTGCATASKNSPLANRPAITRSSLPSEADIPLLATLKTGYEQLRRTTTLVPTDRSNRVVQVAVHELGSGDRDSLVILVHGVLADSDTWRYVASELARDHDVWLVDLPGCGASDKPHPRWLEADGYSPTALGDRVLQAIAVRLNARRTQPTRVVFVSHSLGGMIALRAFAEPSLREKHSSTLAQIGHLVLLAPADVAVHAEIPVFRSIVALKGWMVSVARPLGLVRKATEQATRDGYHMPDRGTRESAAELQQILTNPGTRRAAQAMLMQAVPWRRKEHRPDWPAIQRLAAHYDHIDVPSLIVWGEWDETLPASMGHKLKDEIPGARLVKLSGCGHALPTEKPLETAALIGDYLTGKPLPFVEAKPLRLKSVIAEAEKK